MFIYMYLQILMKQHMKAVQIQVNHRDHQSQREPSQHIFRLEDNTVSMVSNSDSLKVTGAFSRDIPAGTWP